MNVIHEKNRWDSEFTKIAILITGYMSLQVLANLTVAKTVPLLGLSIPIGSLLYAVSFTWMDVINHDMGVKKVKILIRIVTVLHLLTALWLRIYILLPTNEWSIGSFEANAIEYVFGNYFRITFASIITGYISGNINAIIFSNMTMKSKYPIYVDSIVSNVVASAIDGVLFYMLAFTFSKAWLDVIVFSGSSALYKCLISVISVPLLYMARKFGLLYDEEGEKNEKACN